jgi:hypothetical protein
MMTKQQLHKFIKDTKGLVRGAPTHKKIKLLKLIKEAKRRCDEQELKEMDIDDSKIDGTLGSKYATAALVGAMREAGAVHHSEMEPELIQPITQENPDYIEEK